MPPHLPDGMGCKQPLQRDRRRDQHHAGGTAAHALLAAPQSRSGKPSAGNPKVATDPFASDGASARPSGGSLRGKTQPDIFDQGAMKRPNCVVQAHFIYYEDYIHVAHKLLHSQDIYASIR